MLLIHTPLRVLQRRTKRSTGHIQHEWSQFGYVHLPFPCQATAVLAKTTPSLLRGVIVFDKGYTLHDSYTAGAWLQEPRCHLNVVFIDNRDETNMLNGLLERVAVGATPPGHQIT